MKRSDVFLLLIAMVALTGAIIFAIVQVDADPPATSGDVEGNLTAIECTVALLLVEPEERRDIPDDAIAAVCGIPAERVTAARSTFTAPG